MNTNYPPLPLTIEVHERDSEYPGNGLVISVKELPGCITQAGTWEDLWPVLTDAIHCWYQARINITAEPKRNDAKARMEALSAAMSLLEHMHQHYEDRLLVDGLSNDDPDMSVI